MTTINTILIRTSIAVGDLEDVLNSASAYGMDAVRTYSTALHDSFEFSTDNPNVVAPFLSAVEAITRRPKSASGQ